MAADCPPTEVVTAVVSEPRGFTAHRCLPSVPFLQVVVVHFDLLFTMLGAYVSSIPPRQILS